MSKNEFMRIARARRLSCGDHFVIYDNGIIEKFSIFANEYDGFRYVYAPPKYGDTEEYADNYLYYVERAYEKESTLFLKYGCPPPKFIDEKCQMSLEVGTEYPDNTLDMPYIS